MGLTTPTKVEINVNVHGPKEEKEKANALQQIVSNLDHDVLLIIAEKSAKTGINAKVRQFKGML